MFLGKTKKSLNPGEPHTSDLHKDARIYGKGMGYQ